MAKRRTQERGYIESIEGQLTIWDVQITKKPAPVTKTEELITKNKVKDTEEVNFVTEMQGKVIDKYKNSSGLNRIIRYCGGGVGIELNSGNGFRTIYKQHQPFKKTWSTTPLIAEHG